MIGFLVKGLLRDRSRSTLPMIVVAVGALLTVFLYSFVQGSIGQMVDTTARLDAGHVEVTTREYIRLAELLPNDLALTGVASLEREFAAAHPHFEWLPRIRFGGLIDVPDAQGETRAQAAVYGLGVRLRDATRERHILWLDESLTAGRLPAAPGEILLGEPLASALGVTPGQKASIISSTFNGSMAVQTFTVTGLIRYGIPQLDRRLLVLDIEDARTALDMADAASEIIGFARDGRYDESEAAAASAAINGAHREGPAMFAPVARTLAQHGQVGGTLAIARRVGALLTAVFLAVMSLVLWNAGLMNGIRRYGELGVRMALGQSKRTILRSLMAEAAIIGWFGSLVGSAIGLALALWFESHGVDIGRMGSASAVMNSVVRADVTTTSIWIGFVPGLLASIIGTFFAGINLRRRQTSQLFAELTS